MFKKEYSEVKEDTLSQAVKGLIAQGNYEKAEKNIVEAMMEYPHNAIPHNLMGILLEHENNHCLAMKHFRAASALDASFRPARYNIDKYGTFYENVQFLPDAYVDADCPQEGKRKDLYKIVYDDRGIGHVVKR